ncbi:hypothetical protein EOM39_03805 [Candidatus Gracilibacteria bacterium]|nr:hypothetical protein [Candidatus Gracilibacteria bacterium]
MNNLFYHITMPEVSKETSIGNVCEKERNNTTEEVFEILNINSKFGIRKLLNKFVEFKKKDNPKFKLRQKDIFSNVSMFREFEDYCVALSMDSKLISSEHTQKEIYDFIDKFKEKYSYHVGRSTVLYEAILKNQGFSKEKHNDRQKMLDFNAIYNLLKFLYCGEKGKQRTQELIDKGLTIDEKLYEKKFDSIVKNTFDIVLGQKKKYNLNQILASMLFEFTRDFPGANFELLGKLFTDNIADRVRKYQFGVFNIETTENVERDKESIETDNLNKVIDIKNFHDFSDFKELLEMYIKDEKLKNRDYGLAPDDIDSNLAMFRGFEDYCLSLSAAGLLISSNHSYEEIKDYLDKFKKKHFFEVRKSTEYQHQLKKKFSKKVSKNEMFEIRDEFKAVYHLMKSITSGKFRKTPDEEGNPIRDFEHLKGTMDIILNELPYPNRDRLKIAMIHDLLEDFPGITLYEVKFLFGDKIANGVKELTKVDRKNYLTTKERFEIESFEVGKTKKELKVEIINTKWYGDLVKRCKGERDKLYFGHLDKLDKDVLYVKFADRINNLRTLDGLQNAKKVQGYHNLKLKEGQIGEIVRKIIQTERYFSKIAYFEKVKNPYEKNNAYDLLKTEIDNLKSIPGVIDAYRQELEDSQCSIRID